ncbi:MAG: ABC transporter ATP-binding protein [Deltaproteobacteria bacterium]|nr:MAG: ABC transporter ATP-binding protein [Deltaproteobacteria bacterium]
MIQISAKNLSKSYGEGDAAVHAVSDISLEVGRGEFISIMGESGSGKSTLLSMLGALNSPSAGSYEVEELEVYKLGSDQRADFRREFIGFVFQAFHLVPYLSVIENVMLPLVTTKKSMDQKRALAQAALERVGLGGKGHRLPSQISGGEAERVAIARAIVNEPPILMADEPTGNLDSVTSKEIMSLLEELNSQGMTIIMVTHSLECAKNANRIIKIADGRVVEDTSTWTTKSEVCDCAS